MKGSLSQSDITRYTNIISSIASASVALTEGVTRESGLSKNSFGLSTLKEKNIHVYIVENRATIDLFINVVFGYSVPTVICALQEKIKKEVELATNFRVESINVNVSNVVFR